MPIFLEEGVFCSREEYERRSTERVRELGNLAVGSIYMAMFELDAKRFSAAKKPVQIADTTRRWRNFFLVTFNICDDDMVPEIRTTEQFRADAFMRPSKTVAIVEEGKRRPTYGITEAYLLNPKENFHEIDMYLAAHLPEPGTLQKK